MLDLLEVEESTGSGFVKSTGVHTVTLVRVGSQDRKSPSKAKALSLTVGGGGKFDDTLYNFLSEDLAPHYIKSDGTPGSLAKRILGPLFAIVGTTDQTVAPQAVEVKNGTKDMDTFIGLSGTDTKIRVAVQMQYNDYQKTLVPVVLAVFNEDGFSATEIKAGATEPKQINLYATLADKVAPEGTDTKSDTPSAEEEANAAF